MFLSTQNDSFFHGPSEKKQLPQNKSINQEEVSETQKSQVQHEREIRVAQKSSREAGQGKKEAQSSSISNQKKRW